MKCWGGKELNLLRERFYMAENRKSQLLSKNSSSHEIWQKRISVNSVDYSEGKLELRGTNNDCPV